jgi:putative Mn2+ efflux pump MntP
MNYFEIFLIAVGLSMDAFAVSICKGLALKDVKIKHMVTVGLWFGGFQALMPLIGFYLGSAFRNYITAIDHWIAFILLLFIGINMVRESFSKEEDDLDASFAVKKMFLLAVATSIDALATGISFAFLDVNIFSAVTMIGLTTFIFSFVGIRIGSVFGKKYKSKAELAGGIILIILGVKILLEHLGVINF